MEIKYTSKDTTGWHGKLSDDLNTISMNIFTRCILQAGHIRRFALGKSQSYAEKLLRSQGNHEVMLNELFEFSRKISHHPSRMCPSW